ncbi:MAG: alpha/beta hydrolase [Planctomycetaceae bacterium]|jgi:pimeloyl-ACP methyl ester carboxylesterase|nr:alpha/beta hydrolase [Planctomycetaceae bacterium]
MNPQTEQPRIIFLPGLGADHRLFKHQTAAFPNSVAIDWIDPEPNETLEDYAVRFADSLPKQLEQTTPILVCGLSLGGMMAPYFARHLGAAACVLLGSIREPQEFPKRFYPAWLLIRFCPPLLWVVMFSAQYVVRFLGFLVGREIIKQFIETKTSTLVYHIRMMLTWAYRRRNEKELWNIPTFQVHGTNDPLLPMRRTRPDVKIKGGRHVLTLTHPEEINTILREMITQINTVR